jgi:hypothetical protein
MSSVHPDLEHRVVLGVLLLDEAFPGWDERINTDRLRMESDVDDVLGQLYGSFVDGFRQALAHRSAFQLFSAADHGFTLFDDEQDVVRDPVGTTLRFQALTQAWRDVVRERARLREGG